MAKKPTRLRFTEDDLADKAVRQAADRAEKAVGKAEKAVEKASKPKKKLRTEADVSKARSSKLRFDKAEIEPELDKPSRGKHMISRAFSAAIASKAHQAVSEHEDDNVGVQAVHQSEEAGEAAAYTVDHAIYSKKLKAHDKAEKLIEKSDRANVDALYEKYKKDSPDASTNPISSWRQKQAIKKEYAAAKTGKSTAGSTAAASKNAGKAAKETKNVTQKLTEFVTQHSKLFIQRLVSNLFKSTTPKGSQSNDPFWDTAASMLLLALVFYLHYEAPEDEQNFAMVMEMLRAGVIEDEEEPRPSPLDNLFSELEYENPDHIALKYYHSYHSGSAKTLKSIQITLAARLEKFNLESLASLTSTDELELETLGEKKTALFALIPDNDTSFNFLVSILYTQLFQQLFYSADHIHGGSLPIPVHFLMDEFANVSLPDDFDKILSVMRSRSVSVSIILQNLAQLKALFEKQWESIVGNCDEFLYLGGNEQSTHKYVSELLGKSTIDTNTYGKSEGRSGSYSTNYQISGRELLTPDEVRMLDNRYAILFIRGERPVLDFKYDILKHPNVALTADGKAGVYEHGEVKSDVATIELLSFDKYKAPETEVAETNYELLSDEDFEND